MPPSNFNKCFTAVLTFTSFFGFNPCYYLTFLMLLGWLISTGANVRSFRQKTFLQAEKSNDLRSHDRGSQSVVPSLTIHSWQCLI